MPYQFFFSYARDDSDGHDRLDRFFRDLRAEVRELAGMAADDPMIGFRDTTNIQTGDVWAVELQEALQTSKVFVCLVSPTYINKEFCGKEYQVFYERVNWAKSAEAKRTILPVIWTPVQGEMPEIVTRFQLHDDQLPAAYREEGLHYLLKLDMKSEYNAFVTRFAKKIYEAAHAATLKPLDPFPDFKEIASAFHVKLAGGVPTKTRVTAGGPNNARFLFVAARQSEIQKCRKTIERYSEDGGWFWRPYLPAEDKTVGLIAQEVASSEKLRYLDMSLDPEQDLVGELHKARAKNEIVIIVVDVWSVKLPEYKELMRTYDEERLLNCAVLVPWNDDWDNETAQNRPDLEETLIETFENNIATSQPIYFNYSISSPEELRANLQESLTKIRLTIIERSQPARRIRLQPRPAPTLTVARGEPG